MDSHSSVAEAQGSLGSQIHNPDNVAFFSESSGVFISSTLELSREASAGRAISQKEIHSIRLPRPT